MIAHGTHSAYVHLRCRCELCRDGEAEYQRGYRLRNAERLREYDRRPERDTRLRDDPEKRRTRERAYDKLARRFLRPPCEDCGSQQTQLHHDDYSQPFKITWLCPRCHGRRHRKPNTGGMCGA